MLPDLLPPFGCFDAGVLLAGTVVLGGAVWAMLTYREPVVSHEQYDDEPARRDPEDETRRGQF